MIATGPAALHQAQLIADWGNVTLLTNRAFSPGHNARNCLAERGVIIEGAGIERIERHADIRLTGGRCLSFAGLFIGTRSSPATPIAEALGCVLEDTSSGTKIGTDASKETSVRGACGDAAGSANSVSRAVGDGAWAGVQVHQSLAF